MSWSSAGRRGTEQRTIGLSVGEMRPFGDIAAADTVIVPGLDDPPRPASPRTPAWCRDGVSHELDGDVDIVAISPDGLAGIIYQDEGWYAFIDLVDPGSPATRLLPDADQDPTFAFVAAD